MLVRGTTWTRLRERFEASLLTITELKNIPSEFQELLRNQRIVHEKSIPHYAVWVSKFLNLVNRDTARVLTLRPLPSRGNSSLTSGHFLVSKD